MTASLKELIEQRAALDVKINEQRKVEHGGAVQKVRQLVSEYGLTQDDIFGRTRGTKGGTVAPKYRDPATGQTWTGRGKAPKWIEGQAREKFAI